jgi:hypothetical protein
MSFEHLVITFFKCLIFQPHFVALIHHPLAFLLLAEILSQIKCRLRDDKIGSNRINLANADSVARIKFRPDNLPESIHISSACVSHAKYFMQLK